MPLKMIRMLKDEKGKKPTEIKLSPEKWDETKRVIREGIKKKLDASKRIIETDKEVSAGLYIYALEEFGKLLLLDKSNLNDGRRIIKYRDQYVNHETKFGIAFDYLQQRDYINCI
jgi:hypothetical protein